MTQALIYLRIFLSHDKSKERYVFKGIKPS